MSTLIFNLKLILNKIIDDFVQSRFHDFTTSSAFYFLTTDTMADVPFFLRVYNIIMSY